ncbi:MAG: sensor histidine kinase [Gemmatimonadales bacterium]
MGSDTFRRSGPAAVVALAFLFGALSVGSAWVVARHLSDDARDTSRLFGRVFAGLSDPRPDAATEALFDLAAQVRALGIPLAVTDSAGRVTAMENAPSDVVRDSAHLRAWVAVLDAINPPVPGPGKGLVHYGTLPITRRLTTLALLEGLVLIVLVGLAVWAYRERLGAVRDRLWVAMARESAHQLGTPLMSLTGWVAHLREHPGEPAAEVAVHLQADVERLERVARRFERIGRPPRREPVGLGAVAERVVAYFRPRLPTRANPVTLSLIAAGPGPTIQGDPVLVEWALEALVKNAVDALSGRGGHVAVQVEGAGTVARLSVRDDGPGIPAGHRGEVFEPGVSSKPGGWGLGLPLARRIVEQQHRGRVHYHPGNPGSTFVLEFPLAAERGQ